MLFNRRRISELGAEIKSLRQKLSDADAVIADQKIKIEELSDCLVRRNGKSNQNNKATTQATPGTTFASTVSLDDIAKLLYEFVCEDKEARLDQHVNPKTIFDIIVKHKAMPHLQDDLLKIISGSGKKGLLVSHWKRGQANSGENPVFSKMLPILFNFLSKHWWVGRDTDKTDILKYSNLKYNANAYALLYLVILPQLVVDAEMRKKDLAVESENKKKEKEQQRIQKIQKSANEKQKRELEVSKAAINGKHLVDEYGETFLVECWIELGGGTSNPPSASKYISSLAKKLSKHHRYNPAKVKDVKAVLYLIEEVLPPLALSYQQLKENERQRLAQEILEKNKRDIEVENQEDWIPYQETLEVSLQQHAAAFIRNMRAAYKKDDYGAVLKDERDVEIERFLRSVNLIQRAKRHGLKKTFQYINRWYAKQKRAFEQSDAVPEDGHDFEHWVASKLNDAGWTASVTQASGDDGVDVIAVRNGSSVAVQCKRFKGSVGNKAVQEVYSGMKHMQLDRAVVISTGQYTKAAQNLASTTGVILLSEHDIPHLWELLRY